mgnify:CR=1 FL=1
MMFSTKTKVIFISLISALTLTSGAYACSLDGWSSSTGAVAVGQPFNASGGDINGVARFEELCALQVNGTGHVETDAPSHTRVRARAYLFPDSFSGTNDSKVLVALDGSGTELFWIAWNDGQWAVSSATEGAATTPASGGYDLVEFDWDPAGSGDLLVWVNSDAANGDPADMTVSAGPAATLETIRIGLPNGLNGNSGSALYVDSVEMHNETAIGPLFNCDSAPSGVIDISDIVAIIDEFTGTIVSSGTPNCDPTGGFINISDVVATIDAFTS